MRQWPDGGYAETGRSPSVDGERVTDPCTWALYPSEQKQDENDHEHEAQPSRRVIAPAAAVGPGGEGTNEKQNQDDDQNSPERHD
jgi:hypothetical protein